jgi:regulator of RNase E activity RraA
MTLKDSLRRAIEDNVANEEICTEDEEECFIRHPIHAAGWTNNRLDLVYADVDGMVTILAREVQKYAATHDILTEPNP